MANTVNLTFENGEPKLDEPERGRVGEAIVPMIRPRITTRFGLRLSYVDDKGKSVDIAMSDHDLAYLRLTIAEAEERRAKANLAKTCDCGERFSLT